MQPEYVCILFIFLFSVWFSVCLTYFVCVFSLNLEELKFRNQMIAETHMEEAILQLLLDLFTLLDLFKKIYNFFWNK